MGSSIYVFFSCILHFLYSSWNLFYLFSLNFNIPFQSTPAFLFYLFFYIYKVFCPFFCRFDTLFCFYVNPLHAIIILAFGVTLNYREDMYKLFKRFAWSRNQFIVLFSCGNVDFIESMNSRRVFFFIIRFFSMIFSTNKLLETDYVFYFEDELWMYELYFFIRIFRFSYQFIDFIISLFLYPNSI